MMRKKQCLRVVFIRCQLLPWFCAWRNEGSLVFLSSPFPSKKRTCKNHVITPKRKVWVTCHQGWSVCSNFFALRRLKMKFLPGLEKHPSWFNYHESLPLGYCLKFVRTGFLAPYNFIMLNPIDTPGVKGHRDTHTKSVRSVHLIVP